jgi:hypothetical protein
MKVLREGKMASFCRKPAFFPPLNTFFYKIDGI